MTQKAADLLLWRHKDCSDPVWKYSKNFSVDDAWFGTGNQVRLRMEIFHQLGDAMGLLGEYSPYWTKLAS